jgi:hypothetical protein
MVYLQATLARAGVLIFGLMEIKGGQSYSSSNAEDLVGTFFGSFILVIAMVFACVACRRKQG